MLLIAILTKDQEREKKLSLCFRGQHLIQKKVVISTVL